jgi:hypothetical protein
MSPEEDPMPELDPTSYAYPIDRLDVIAYDAARLTAVIAGKDQGCCDPGCNRPDMDHPSSECVYGDSGPERGSYYFDRKTLAYVQVVAGAQAAGDVTVRFQRGENIAAVRVSDLDLNRSWTPSADQVASAWFMSDLSRWDC